MTDGLATLSATHTQVAHSSPREYGFSCSQSTYQQPLLILISL